MLPQALESDTFAIISSDPSPETLSCSIQILQESPVAQPIYSQLVSARSKVIAVVDRTADLALAAEQLVTARFAFGGTSPYAPDLVFVNEYIKKDFLEHVLRHSIQFLSGSHDVEANSTPKSPTQTGQKAGSPVTDTLKRLQDNKSWRPGVVTQGDRGAVLELAQLSTLPSKITQPILCVSSITSLEHAINLVDEDLDPQETLTAAYHFGTPSTGKYLSQFIKADVSFTNHIPYRLLLGPAAPSSHPIDIEKRYTTNHFTRASPAYITPPASQSAIAKVVAGKDARKAATELLTQASQEIKQEKRPEWIAIGFFEQGIFIGLGVYGIPILTCVGASLFYGVRAGLRRWAF